MSVASEQERTNERRRLRYFRAIWRIVDTLLRQTHEGSKFVYGFV